MIREILTEIYHLLYERFGPQHWWPGQTPLEIMMGAILTQNTNWKNVEKAIANLQRANLLNTEALENIDQQELAQHIRPAGYYNIKAKRLKAFIHWFWDRCRGNSESLMEVPADQLREELLSIKGIGPETADSILLYAFHKPVFVVDAYTARILGRHQLITPPVEYPEMQALFENALPQEVSLYNEYHALLVRCGKEYCQPKPCCRGCPLDSLPHVIGDTF